MRVIEFTHVCSSLFSPHMRKRTHAKHRLAVVTHWPRNRCCEQCESGLHLLSSAAPPPLWYTAPHPESHSSCLSPSPARPPRPGHFPSHAPPIFFSTWFLNRGQNTETFASNLKRLRLSIAVSVFLHTLCMHEVLLIYLKPICEFKSLTLHVNIDEQQS